MSPEVCLCLRASDCDSRLRRYYNEPNNRWLNYAIAETSLQNLPCRTQGNILIDTGSTSEESHDTLYVLYSSWESVETRTLVYKFTPDTTEVVDLNFDGYLEPSRLIEFQQHPLNGDIYAAGRPRYRSQFDGETQPMGACRSDVQSALVGDSPYPHLYWLNMASTTWTNITRQSTGEKSGYVYFYALSFMNNGDPVVAYILSSDKKTIHVMRFDTEALHWVDAPSIHHFSLPGHQNIVAYFLDGDPCELLKQLKRAHVLSGVKFARDRHGEVYLYFKTYSFGDAWPDNAFSATLWILKVPQLITGSYSVSMKLEGIYGTFTSIQDDYFEDSTLGHLVFDLRSDFLAAMLEAALMQCDACRCPSLCIL